jgi:dihydrolipoamide dehydrogenase
VLSLEAAGAAASAQSLQRARSRPPAKPAPAKAAAPVAASYAGGADLECDMLVLGAGPGGYSAAFRAADLGLKVVLVERYATLGGVCLNVGCIPSKALLHVAAVMDEVSHFADLGRQLRRAVVDLSKLKAHKNKVVGKLTGGLAAMAKMRKVTVVRGWASSSDPTPPAGRRDHRRRPGKDRQKQTIKFRKAIIAAGSEAMHLPFMPKDDPRVVDLDRRAGTARIAQAHADSGWRHHRPGNGHGLFDAGRAAGRGGNAGRPDAGRRPRPGQGLAEDERQALRQRHAQDQDGGRRGHQGRHPGHVRRRGRTQRSRRSTTWCCRPWAAVPNGKKIGADKAGVAVTDRGFIPVDIQMRTNVPHIFAIGDIVGQPMLAHKAVHEAHVAAEVAAGELGDAHLSKAAFDARVIPSVAYTDPEVAWVGLTEDQAKAQGIKVKKGLFPWSGLRSGDRQRSRRRLHQAAVRREETATASWAGASSARMRAT